MKRIWNVIGNLLILAAVAALAVVLVRFGGLRGEQAAPRVGAFQSPLGPTSPPPLRPTATVMGTPTASPTPLIWPTSTPKPTPTSSIPVGIRLVREIQLTTEDSGCPTWSPDGTKIAFCRSAGKAANISGVVVPLSELWVMDADGDSHRKLADNGRWPAWSPDGKLIAYVSTIDEWRGEIWITNLDGSEKRKIADAKHAPIQWAADGSIAFIQNEAITIMDEEATTMILLDSVKLLSYLSRADFWLAPDGSKVAYWDESFLKISKIDDSRVETVGEIEAPHMRNLTWSQDSSKIAYVSGIFVPQPELRVVNADGSHKLLLAKAEMEHFNYITWSPDNRFIAFTRCPTGSNMASELEIYVVRAGGSEVFRLTNNHLSEAALAWSPSGTEIAFIRYGIEKLGEPGRTIWLAVLEETQ